MDLYWDMMMDIWWDITDDFEMMGFISWDIVSVILEVNLRRKKKKRLPTMWWFHKKNAKWFMIFGPFSFKSHWKYMSNLTCSYLFISRMWILLQLHLQISFRRTEPTGGCLIGSVTIFHRKRLPLEIRCDVFMGYVHGIVWPYGNLTVCYWKWL